MQPVAISHRKILLARHAETEPKNIGLGLVDDFDNPLLVALAAEIAATVPDDIELRISRFGPTNGLIDHGLGCAKEEHACATPLPDDRGIMEEISRRDALGKRCPVKQPRHEYHRHAVGVDQVGSEKKLAKPG